MFEVQRRRCVQNGIRVTTTALIAFIAAYGATAHAAEESPLHHFLQAHQDLSNQRQRSFESLLIQNAPQDRPTLLGQETLRLEPVRDEAATETVEDTSTAQRAKETDQGPSIDEMDARDVDPSGPEIDGGGVNEENQRRDTTISHLMKLRKPITDIRLASGPQASASDRPSNRASELLVVDGSRWITATGSVVPPPNRYPVAFCHRPLYYQQPDLERCGQTYRCGGHKLGCLQNAVSGFTFLVNTMVLPYRIATERPGCLISHQGDCRTCQNTGGDIDPLQPGTCGCMTEAAAIAGFTFLLL